MKRVIIFLCILTSFSIIAKAANKEPIRAVWLTTIGGIDWPRTYSTSISSQERQKRELTDMLDRLRLAGINTVLLQTRVRGTVIYPSDYEPWDGCVSGRPGRSPGYDPLQFAITEAHKRGMELHAWVVTIPIGKWNSYGCKQLRQKMPAALKKIGDEGYMNPEAYQTADYLANICAEIASRYDVDGIHLDYIRYPETWKQRVNRMEARDNITNIVRRIYGRVKAINPQIKVSCSPIGKYTNLSRYNSNGWDALNRVHQDAQGWLRMGIMDQLYPMMYFKGNNFYPFAINWKENSYGKDIVPGLGIYFLDPREGNWKIDDIKRQLYFLRSEGMGFCLFRAKYLLDNIKGIYDFLRTEYLLSEELRVKSEELRVKSEEFRGGNSAGFLENDGRTMVLPEKGKVLDADVIAFVSMAGNVITTRPYRGKRADIRAIPDGIYTLRSVNKKGVTHRVGMVYIRR